MLTIEREIASQPEVWSRAACAAGEVAASLPPSGARVAIIGCGTSLYVAQAIAGLRERAGRGESNALPASEAVLDGRYDAIIAISRSGETTEVLRALQGAREGVPTIAICGSAGSPVSAAADRVVALEFADEESIVQTRFATAVLAFFRSFLGENLEALIEEAGACLDAPLPFEPEAINQFVFLGAGWTVGLANEAALKMREAAGAWSESYPAMEYRHGPISASGEATLVWALGGLDGSVLEAARQIGAEVVNTGLDPMTDLILIHRTAIQLAQSRGLDPLRPAHLSRAVILDGEHREVNENGRSRDPRATA